MQVKMSQITPVCVAKLQAMLLLSTVMLLQSVRGMSWTDLVPGLDTYQVRVQQSRKDQLIARSFKFSANK